MQKKLMVNGMHCPGCEKLVSMSIDELRGVTVQAINYKSGELVIDYEEEEVLPQVIKKIEDNGYNVIG
ncbi:MAG: heavy-metal-associated domain-containing protein [bacterium]